jgi:hypothetical protein
MIDHTDPVLERLARANPIGGADLADHPLLVDRDRVFREIVSGARPSASRVHRPSSSRRTRAAFALTGAAVLAAALTVTLVGQTVVAPVKARAAGVHFARRGETIVATIDDPSAPAASMEAAFAQAGLDVGVDVTPSSPSIAGTITFLDTPPSFEPVYGPEGSCLLPGGGTRCIVGMRVPADFSGTATIAVNGTPAAGELYDSVNDAFAPGEVLHCSGLRGMTVAEAEPLLQRLGVSPVWRTSDGSDASGGVDVATIEGQFIDDALPRSSDTVYVFVRLDPPSASAYYESLDRGC